MPYFPKFKGGNEGVALVVVLGLLSILLIMVVAFSTSMRTERLATRYYAEGVRARHLVHTALYRVLGEHIADETEGLVYADWTFDVYSAGAGVAEVKLLEDGLAESPMRWVPMSLRSPTLNSLGVDDGVAWLELEDSVTGEVYGEYAFLVVNNSGLLDANVIGAREEESRPRLRGFDPGEIRFHDSVLPESANNTLHTYRSVFRRFETVSELYWLTSTSIFEGQVGAARPLQQLPGSMADHLHVFSRYPRGYGVLGPDGEWDAVDEVAFIGGDPADWDLAAIDTAIEDVIDDPTHRQMFIRALYDYADEGLVPFGANVDEQFRRFSAKPVPMINEVIVSNSLQLVSGGGVNPDTLTHRVYISVETAYPFPENLDNSVFSVELDNLQIDVFPPYFQGIPMPPAVPDPVSFVPNPGNPYPVTRFVIEQSRPVNDAGLPPYPTPGDIQPFSVTVNFDQIRVINAGNPVDVVFGPWPATAFELPGDQPDLSGGGTSGTGRNGAHLVAAMSANDPRMNWDPNNNLHWRSVAPTPGERNAPRIDEEQAEHGYNSDETDWMYARRGPIQSVGEIGYLLFDPTRLWTTVPLLEGGTGVSALLDRFTVHTNRIRRGMVNVNSRQERALMAALWQAPIERYPVTTIQDGSVVTDTMATQLATELAERTSNAGPMANISEIGQAWTPAVMNNVLGADAVNDKFIRESVLRNSLGLLGTRNNLYTIFVAARVFAEGYDPDNDDHFADRANFVASDQRAVAVIWRDPFRTTDSIGSPTYESFIQYFHWITDALED